MTTGRPSTYTADIATLICQRLAAGESLRSICRDTGMPPESTVRTWALDDVAAFTASQYARARELGYLAMGDELLDIADDSSSDTYTDADGAVRPDHAAVARARLRVDTRKWVLAKMLPKVYGDRLTAEVKAPVDEEMSSNDLVRELGFALTLQLQRQEREKAEAANLTPSMEEPFADADGAGQLRRG